MDDLARLAERVWRLERLLGARRGELGTLAARGIALAQGLRAAEASRTSLVGVPGAPVAPPPGVGPNTIRFLVTDETGNPLSGVLLYFALYYHDAGGAAYRSPSIPWDRSGGGVEYNLTLTTDALGIASYDLQLYTALSVVDEDENPTVADVREFCGNNPVGTTDAGGLAYVTATGYRFYEFYIDGTFEVIDGDHDQIEPGATTTIRLIPT